MDQLKNRPSNCISYTMWWIVFFNIRLRKAYVSDIFVDILTAIGSSKIVNVYYVFSVEEQLFNQIHALIVSE